MKKFWLSYLFLNFLFLALFTLVLWIILPVYVIQLNKITSPLPSFLTFFSNNEVTSIDLWKPVEKVLGSSISSVDISAKAALSYDIDTNQMLFSKDPNERLPMASLTKIMTAIVGLEHPKDDNRYLVPKEALVGEDSMGLSSGEVLSLEELLYGLVLHSGNDAAETIAYNSPMGRQKFISAMNEKAKALGLTNTNFTNPTGLEGDGDQYTTAYDLLVMTGYGLQTFPLFKKVVATTEIDLPANATHKEYYLQNETNLLTSYPGVKGVKTGYTPEAGLCLVTYLEYGGHHIIAVVLGSDDRRGDMKQILDLSLEKLGITPPPHD